MISTNPNFVKDPTTGILVEKRQGYSASTELTGATAIPSHDGAYGAQLGTPPPLIMITDPEYPDKVVERFDRYGRLLDTVEPQPTRTEQMVANEIQPKKRGRKPNVVAEAPQSQIDPFAEMLRMKEELENIKMSYIAAPPKEVKPVEPEPVADEKSDVQEPKIEAMFSFKDGSRVRTFYHRIIHNGITLVLVSDTRFKYATIYTPPTGDEENTFMLKTYPHNKEYTVFSTGQTFRDGDLEYVILFVLTGGE